MAISPLQPGAAPANVSMRQSSRRRVLGLFAAAPLATLPAASQPASADADDWAREMARLERARAALEADNERFEEIYQNWLDSRPSIEIIRWQEFPFRDRHQVAWHMDLDSYWEAHLSGEGRTWWARDREATNNRVRAALDSIREFRRLESEHRIQAGLDAALARSDLKLHRVTETEDKLLTMPAPHGEALAWKLERLLAQLDPAESGIPAEVIASIQADAHRLAGDVDHA